MLDDKVGELPSTACAPSANCSPGDDRKAVGDASSSVSASEGSGWSGLLIVVLVVAVVMLDAEWGAREMASSVSRTTSATITFASSTMDGLWLPKHNHPGTNKAIL
jgi:hypothetical protein